MFRKALWVGLNRQWDPLDGCEWGLESAGDSPWEGSLGDVCDLLQAHWVISWAPEFLLSFETFRTWCKGCIDLMFNPKV